MTTHPSRTRTASAGTSFMYVLPTASVHTTEARHDPSGHRFQPDWRPNHHLPLLNTSTARGGSYTRRSSTAVRLP